MSIEYIHQLRLPMIAIALALTTPLALAANECVFPAQAQQGTAPSEVGLGAQFKSGAAEANGTTLHYVRGGSGPAVILLQGRRSFCYTGIPRIGRNGGT